MITAICQGYDHRIMNRQKTMAILSSTTMSAKPMYLGVDSANCRRVETSRTICCEQYYSGWEVLERGDG